VSFRIPFTAKIETRGQLGRRSIGCGAQKNPCPNEAR
jgi:hypothetical protein